MTATAPASERAHPLTSRVPRVDSLTGLRWWAAFGVFFFHMAAFAPLPNPILNVSELGHYGVTFFFVLSGFVLVLSARAGTPNSTFYWRRFARIYPSHLVALLLAFPVFYSVAPSAEQWWVKPVDPGVMALSFPLLQGWSRDDAVLFSGNPAAWTLSCELFFYAIFPFVLAGLIRLGLRGALVASAAVVALAVALGIGAHIAPEIFGSIPWPILRTPEFLLGMTLGWAVRLGWRPRWLPLSGTLVLTVLLALILSFPGRFAALGPFETAIRWGANEIVIVLCALMIVSASVNDLNGRRSILRTPALVRLGEWSYAFYLVHATVMYVIFAFVGAHPASWSNWPWYVLVLTGALVLAAAVHHWVEAPVERRLRRWKDERDRRRTAAAVTA
ncbi:acyltransferase [Leucobacter allii]|uniref:acyltransferase family protein n=1 Tax=Leucobacter allii TaxID=2932247 RepID=UPI001FD42673|nr:acyltransferase [Leucobacter allii]UOR02254.1 acyltransferase [Leucobacter allii]